MRSVAHEAFPRRIGFFPPFPHSPTMATDAGRARRANHLAGAFRSEGGYSSSEHPKRAISKGGSTTWFSRCCRNSFLSPTAGSKGVDRPRHGLGQLSGGSGDVGLVLTFIAMLVEPFSGSFHFNPLKVSHF